MAEIEIDLKDCDLIKVDNGYIFDPYNPENVEITLKDIQCILTKYGIPPIIHNIELYKRAFIHRSYTKRPQFENQQQNITIVEKPGNCLPLKSKSNERLEFLGDGILELVTKYYLYRRFPKENEGFMTSKKISIVKNESDKPKKVKEVIEFVKKSGGIEYAKEAMNRYYADALDLLKELPDTTYRNSLSELVKFTIERKN